MKTYKGKYKIKNKDKYCGIDANNIIYRSLWERQVFKFLDNQQNVIRWASESIIIPYRSKIDNKVHRYFIDVYFQTKDLKEYLIEIKPKKETMPPKKNNLNEVKTYAKNISKWEAAQLYANEKNMIFEIWTEDTLKKLGIKLIK